MACTNRHFAVHRNTAPSSSAPCAYQFCGSSIISFGECQVFSRSSCLQLVADDLAADGLGQLVAEFHDARVFVGRGVLLDVVLDFLFQLLRRRRCPWSARCVALTTCPRISIRHGGDAAFEHVGQLHDDAFDLERPDAVAGGLDDVVRAADIPEVAVLIPPGQVAGVVPCRRARRPRCVSSSLVDSPGTGRRAALVTGPDARSRRLRRRPRACRRRPPDRCR